MRDKLIELIEKGEIRTALGEMKKVVRKHPKTESEFGGEVSQLLSRFIKIEGDFNTKGIISDSLYISEYNKIIAGVREILNKLPEEIFIFFPKVENTETRVGGSNQNNYHATAFFISPHHALTSYSAVQELFKENPDKVEVRLYFNSKKEVIAGQIDREDCHPSLNIALIEVSSQECSSANFVEWDAFSPASSDRFFIYGFPQNALEAVGFFLSIEEVIKPAFNLQEFILRLETGEKTTISLEGMRGAPLISCRTGKICGIVTKTDDKSGKITATPSFEITKRHNKIKKIIHAPLKASLEKKEECVRILRDYLIQNYTLVKLKTVEKEIQTLLDNRNLNIVELEGKIFPKEVFIESLTKVLISKNPKPFVEEHNNFLKDFIKWLSDNHLSNVHNKGSKLFLLYFYLFYLFDEVDRGVFSNSVKIFSNVFNEKFELRIQKPWEAPRQIIFKLRKLEEAPKNMGPFDEKIYMFLLFGGELTVDDLEEYKDDNWLQNLKTFMFPKLDDVTIKNKFPTSLGFPELKEIYDHRKNAKRKKLDWNSGQFFVHALALILKEVKDPVGYHNVCDVAFNC